VGTKLGGHALLFVACYYLCARWTALAVVTAFIPTWLVAFGVWWVCASVYHHWSCSPGPKEPPVVPGLPLLGVGPQLLLNQIKLITDTRKKLGTLSSGSSSVSWLQPCVHP
jgi:hypothetical protein